MTADSVLQTGSAFFLCLFMKRVLGRAYRSIMLQWNHKRNTNQGVTGWKEFVTIHLIRLLSYNSERSQTMKKIIWKIEPLGLPLVLRHCKKCGKRQSLAVRDNFVLMPSGNIWIFGWFTNAQNVTQPGMRRFIRVFRHRRWTPICWKAFTAMKKGLPGSMPWIFNFWKETAPMSFGHPALF